MTRLPFIRCAVCGTRVEYTSVSQVPESRYGWVLAVECHGDRETMEITFDDAFRLGPEGLRQIAEGEGVAFQTKRVLDL